MGQAASYLIRGVYDPFFVSEPVDLVDPPPLPAPISAQGVLDHSAAPSVWKDLRERGYCVIDPGDQTAGLVQSCKDSVAEFFSLPLEDKVAFEMPVSTDPLLRGRRPNRGYIRGKGKEYLKIRLIDESKSYPKDPPALEENFRTGMDAMRDIAFNALYGLGTVEVGGNTCLDVVAVDKIKSFFPEGSSVSVIKYFVEDEGTEEDHVPLGEHVDTGVMTLIRISEVPGLQIFDQLHQKFLNVEELGEVGSLVLILGRKIELLLSRSVKLEPTLHKVVIPKNKERFSILFFMDLPGGKDT